MTGEECWTFGGSNNHIQVTESSLAFDRWPIKKTWKLDIEPEKEIDFLEEAQLVELLEGGNPISSNVDIENKIEGFNGEGTEKAGHDAEEETVPPHAEEETVPLNDNKLDSDNNGDKEEQPALEVLAVVEEISEPEVQCVDEQLVGHTEEIVEEAKENQGTTEIKKEKKEGIFTQLGNLFSGTKQNVSGEDQQDESEHSFHETEPRLAKLVKEASADSLTSSAASSSRAARRGSNFLPLSRSGEARDGCRGR